MPKIDKDPFAKLPTFEMCPIGSHVVKGHYRICKGGTKTWVDIHIRRNRKSRKMYLSENLLYIYWNNKKREYKKINPIKGLKGHHKVDPVIQFWLDYWKGKGLKFPSGLTPLHIKAMIAVESSFRVKVRTRAKNSTATGLMQVTNTTRGILSGKTKRQRNDTRTQFITISREDLDNPVIAIAAGVRWLSHKYHTLLRSKKIKDKSLKATIRDYHSRDKAGEDYAAKVLLYYNQSK